MTGYWDEIPIGNPARRALRNAGYVELDDLTRATREQIADLHGMGPKALGILQAELERRGSGFATA